MESGPGTGRKNILIVDDDALTSLALMKTLEAEDRTIETATRGPQVFEEIRSSRYDLVFLEIGRFDQPGIAFLKEISVFDPRTPIIVTTASFPDDEMESAIAGHGHFLLPKPFERSTIRTLATEILEERKNRESGPKLIDGKTRKDGTARLFKEV